MPSPTSDIWWMDLSGVELNRRLTQRGVSQREADEMSRHREQYARLIMEVLGR